MTDIALTKLGAALAAAAIGLRVHPLHTPLGGGGCSCGRGACKSAGKHPRLVGWQEKATADEAQVREWWAKWPDANIGIANVLGVDYWTADIDPRNGGMETIAALEKEHGPIPDTYAVETGGGGLHLYFRRPEGDVQWKGKIGQGIDVKADGGRGSNLVGPGSTHPSGGIYSVLLDAPLADAPPWLLNLATRTPPQSLRPSRPPAEEEMEVLLEYAQARTDNRPPGKEDGNGGTQCLLAARFLYRELSLPDELARPILDTWLTRCEPPWDDERQITHKIADAKASTQVAEGSGLVAFRIWKALARRRPGGQLPEVKLEVREHHVVDQVAEAVSAHPELYRKDGLMVEAIVDDGPARVRLLPQPRLREMITACVRLQKFDGRTKDWIPAHPPDWLVQEVGARTTWPAARRLVSIIECPTVLEDGRIIRDAGYDADSGLYLTTDLEVSVPDRPTRADAERALATLLDLVSDFPFATEASRAGWVCALLTLMTRHAFSGPTPLIHVDAPVAGSGKTLLVDLISLIIRAMSAARTAYVDDDAETRKKITTTAISGHSMMLFDNLENGSTLASSALDAVLTSEIWNDRLLGTNKDFVGLINCVWFVSGNNISVGGDMARRIMPIRIEPNDERPERRSGFKYDPIDEHVKRFRDRYVGAGLTLAKAFLDAGKPNGHLSSWGSFSGWSHLPRAAVVWAGMPDPGDARGEFVEQADTGRAAGQTLVEELHRIFDRTGFTVGSIIDSAYKVSPGQRDANAALREALEELADVRQGSRVSPRQVGGVLRRLRERRFGALYLVNELNKDTKTARWRIR